MKKVKIILYLGMLMGVMVSAHAQRRTIKVYPKHGTVVTTIHKPKVIVHNGINYHFSDGVWYRPKDREYIVTAAPVGIIVKGLPKGRKIVVRNGRKLYHFKGIWYQKHRGGYRVINV